MELVHTCVEIAHSLTPLSLLHSQKRKQDEVNQRKGKTTAKPAKNRKHTAKTNAQKNAEKSSEEESEFDFRTNKYDESGAESEEAEGGEDDGDDDGGDDGDEEEEVDGGEDDETAEDVVGCTDACSLPEDDEPAEVDHVRRHP